MSPKVGMQYYFITHAYYHLVGKVVALTPRGCVIDDVRFIYSCSRDWTSFFKDGFKEDTTYKIWPNGTKISYIDFMPFPHKIPGKSLIFEGYDD